MKYPEELRYAKTHEWLREQNDEAVIGLTDYAQKELTDIVFVELPKVEAEVVQGEACGIVESVKSASDLYAPISGVVTQVNAKLASHPELVNQDPYGKGWLFQVRMRDTKETEWLLTAGGYRAFLGAEE